MKPDTVRERVAAAEAATIEAEAVAILATMMPRAAARRWYRGEGYGWAVNFAGDIVFVDKETAIDSLENSEGESEGLVYVSFQDVSDAQN